MITTLTGDPRERVRRAVVECLGRVVGVQPVLVSEDDVNQLFGIISIYG